MTQLVILKKYSSSSRFWHNLEKKNKIRTLSTEQILNQYQGFEGELIEMLSIKGGEEDQNEIIKKCKTFSSIPNNVVLFAVSSGSLLPKILQNVAYFVGCDIGVCEKDKTVFSSIFNEILFGNVPELISQQKNLNENWLFAEVLSAEKYVTLHEMLSGQGKDVEDYEQLSIYEVWQYRSRA